MYVHEMCFCTVDICLYNSRQILYRQGIRPVSYTHLDVYKRQVSVGWPVTPENVLVAAHSYDADNRPLSTYSYQDIRFLKIFGVWHP